jgi:magnesium chelatase subunit D
VFITDSLRITLGNPLIRGLACAALQPSLRSVLIYDAGPKTIKIYAKILAQMLEITESKPPVVQLGMATSEDDMWGAPALAPADVQSMITTWKVGLLGSEDKSDESYLLTIPDLTRLSLVGTRACVSAMGSPVVHLERYGQGQSWQPNLCWLAGCSKQKIGTVSPHLLDRFALRLTGNFPPMPSSVNTLMQLLETEQDFDIPPLGKFPLELRQRLEQATNYRPKMTSDSLRRVETYISTLKTYCPRRSIALARLALTQAKLEQMPQVTPALVDRVAAMIGLNLPVEAAGKSNMSQSQQSQKPIRQDKKSSKAEIKTPDLPDVRKETVSLTVYAPDQTESFEQAPLIDLEHPGEPYPEDTAPLIREAMSLKLPSRRFSTRTIEGGPSIGVEPAKSTQDLALFSTFIEAAKYQPIRRKITCEDSKRLILSATDLRRYRRAPVAEQMGCIPLLQ